MTSGNHSVTAIAVILSLLPQRHPSLSRHSRRYSITAVASWSHPCHHYRRRYHLDCRSRRYMTSAVAFTFPSLPSPFSHPPSPSPLRQSPQSGVTSLTSPPNHHRLHPVTVALATIVPSQTQCYHHRFIWNKIISAQIVVDGIYLYIQEIVFLQWYN